MRRFLLVAAIVGTATATQAADMPDFLRGSFTAPVARTNWQGVYIGGQASYGAADGDLGRLNDPHAKRPQTFDHCFALLREKPVGHAPGEQRHRLAGGAVRNHRRA